MKHSSSRLPKIIKNVQNLSEGVLPFRRIADISIQPSDLFDYTRAILEEVEWLNGPGNNYEKMTHFNVT